MQLVSFRARKQVSVGAIQDGSVFDFVRAEGYLRSRGVKLPVPQGSSWFTPSMSEFLAGGDEAMDVGRAVVKCLARMLEDPREVGQLREGWIVRELSDIELLPPVPFPSKILCVGRNYRKLAGAEEPERYPTFFGRFAHSLLAPGAPFILPQVSAQADYEGELVAVVGRGGRDIPEAGALEYVAGYTIFNDISIRDYQKRTSQWFIGKNFNGSGPLGPCIVTRDELTDPQVLSIRTEVSGEIVQEANTSSMLFSVSVLLSYISRVLSLAPGDLLVTGTPPGVGATRVPQRWLQAGDIVRVSISGLGTLETPVLGHSNVSTDDSAGLRANE